MAKLMLQVLCDCFESESDIHELVGELIGVTRPHTFEKGVKTLPFKIGEDHCYRAVINIHVYTGVFTKLCYDYKEILDRYDLGQDGAWNITVVVDYFNGLEEQRGPIASMDFLLEDERKDSVPF